MQLPVHRSPRCQAKSKRIGKKCRSPAVRGYNVCRMHGAHGGAPEGRRNGRYRTGSHTKGMLELKKQANMLIKATRQMIKATRVS